MIFKKKHIPKYDFTRISSKNNIPKCDFMKKNQNYTQDQIFNDI